MAVVAVMVVLVSVMMMIEDVGSKILMLLKYNLLILRVLYSILFRS